MWSFIVNEKSLLVYSFFLFVYIVILFSKCGCRSRFEHIRLKDILWSIGCWRKLISVLYHFYSPIQKRNISQSQYIHDTVSDKIGIPWHIKKLSKNRSRLDDVLQGDYLVLQQVNNIAFPPPSLKCIYYQCLCSRIW